ncbi:hypothetical protein [Brachybacterium massiliense]|nr:hypothetical protein [Brachybacterium massiliense]
MSPEYEEHVYGPEERIAVRDNAAADRYEAVRGGDVVGILLYERSAGASS